MDREERSARWALMVNRLEAAMPSLDGLQAVELGSGRGDLSVLLARRGVRVTLIDASRAALDQARHRFHRLGLSARFEPGDMFAPPEPWRGRFDIVLSSGVIEHFRSKERTLAIQAHYNLLRRGGVAIISVPHARCVPYRLWKRYLELRGWWAFGMELPYTKRELLSRAETAGFVGCEAHGLGFLQSIGGHWWRLLLKRRPHWSDRPCRLDSWMGFTLVLFARRGETAGAHDRPRSDGRGAPTD